MSEPARTLYYVVCPPYHGATFMALLLNSHPAITYLGDTFPQKRYMGARCSCGQLVRDCPFWTYVAEATEAERFSDSARLIPRYPRIAGSRRINKALNLSLALAARGLGRWVWAPFRPAVAEYRDGYLGFADAALAWHGSRVFVDGSKSLVRVLVNRSLMRQADTRVLHLVRDPRAFHASNVKSWGSDFPIGRSCRRWKRKHAAVVRAVRTLPEGGYATVRYEDLCLRTEETLAHLLRFLGVEHRDLLETAKDAEDQHVIGSTSKRRFEGKVEFRESWRNLLSDREARTVLTRTEPYSSRFGYG